MHRIASYIDSTRTWSSEDVNLLGKEEELLPEGWKARLGGEGSWADSVVLLQCALLTDGPETKSYRIGGNDLLKLYTISRRDVAHFMTERLLEDWDQYKGRDVSIGY